MRAFPSVGSVIRLRIFSRVDLPAPLRPMIPTTSPRSISKEMSFRAQKSWLLEEPLNVEFEAVRLGIILYLLLRLSARMTTLNIRSNDVRKRLLRSAGITKDPPA